MTYKLHDEFPFPQPISKHLLSVTTIHLETKEMVQQANAGDTALWTRRMGTGEEPARDPDLKPLYSFDGRYDSERNEAK
jgi:hypothetical protein